MLKPIKILYAGAIPMLDDWREAVRIAKDETCVVEVRWCPHIMAGWYHDYVFADSDPAELDDKTPKVYGI